MRTLHCGMWVQLSKDYLKTNLETEPGLGCVRLSDAQGVVIDWAIEPSEPDFWYFASELEIVPTASIPYRLLGD